MRRFVKGKLRVALSQCMCTKKKAWKTWLMMFVLEVSILCICIIVLQIYHYFPILTPTISQALPQSKCTGSSISWPPSILVLEKLGVFKQITSEKDAFGTFLLEDHTGNKMESIRDDEVKTERINRKVFVKWLNGEGRQPITWSTLIDVLSKAKLTALAEDIGRRVTRNYCNTSSLPYAYSEDMMETMKKLKHKYRTQKVVQFKLLEKFSTANLPFFDLILRDHDRHGTSTSDKILYKVLKDVTKHKRLLITGPPGSGKTTLVRYIARKWANDESLNICQFLFVIYLDKIKKGDFLSLSDLLRDQYKDIMDVSSVSKEILSKSGNGTCLLLDAFDQTDVKADYVSDLMFNNELPNSICIMTSRPDSDLKALNATVDIGGFKRDKLDNYLQILSAGNEDIKDKVIKLWQDKQVKELCQLPLHMAMILFIARTIHASSITTKTQIYTAFMNATIKHYKQPGWNTVSLRPCILSYDTQHSENDQLCNAFKMMHLAAFKMIFESSFIFSVDDTTQEKMKSLGFVSIIPENSASDEVKISFSHITFTEFFAALHLITLPQSDQLFHVQNPMIKKKTGLIDFYFGLLGDFYANNVSALFLPLKQYSAAFAYPIRKWEHVCPRGYYTAQSSSSLRLHQEIGWKGQAYRDLLNSSGIVVQSSVCLSVTNKTMTYLSYLLENHGDIHKLSIVDYSPSLRLIYLDDTRYPLNTTHMTLLECFNCFKDSNISCSRDKHQSNVQQIHIKTDKYNFQTASDLSSAIDWLKGFRKMKSFGLSVHDSSLISSPKVIHMLNNHNVSSIEVHCCISELQNLLISFPNITTLYLEALPDCMQEKNVVILSNALRQPEKLQNLILVPTTEINVPEFLIGLTALRYLHIERMNINGSTAKRLIEVASKNLTILDLSHCKLQGWAVKKLSTHLQSLSKLQNLKLNNASLTDTDVSMLSESIRNLTKLSYLGLSNNNINGEGLQSLVDVLKEIKPFRSLNMFGNPITGHENIITLSQMTNLHTLHISISSSADKKTLIRVVERLKQLESFRWSLV